MLAISGHQGITKQHAVHRCNEFQDWHFEYRFTPEQRLASAMIRLALTDATGNVQRVCFRSPKYIGGIVEEAKEWLASDSDEPFSYNWCKEVLEWE